MKFFKPDDFYRCHDDNEAIAERANAKLEREAYLMYQLDNGEWAHRDSIMRGKPTHTALLINIEPIEACTHPSEKVAPHIFSPDTRLPYISTYKCSCGARVKVKRDGYEVCE